MNCCKVPRFARCACALIAAWSLCGCPQPEGTVWPPDTAPSNNPGDWEVDASLSYTHRFSEVRWVVPSAALPSETPIYASNNNVGIHFFQDRLFFAWRTAPTHFAGEDTLLYVISSEDDGSTWEHELSVALGSDAREPLLYDFDGILYFIYFEAGTNPYSFAPVAMKRHRRLGKAAWTAGETWGDPEEVPWDIRKRNGKIYLTSYLGNHYESAPSDIEVRFTVSDDGHTFLPVSGDSPVVYRGGVSEASFQFTANGDLWAVLRNEDGDESGFGSLLCFAPADDLANWDCPEQSNPERYDSPRLLRHGNDLYLIARRDIGGPFDQGREDLTQEDQKLQYLVDYWNRPKRTAIYAIDTVNREIVHLEDLPSAGDTAFPSIRRTGAHSFLVANYTSPIDDPDRTWVEGQGAVDGTQIYLVDLLFESGEP